MVIATFEHKDGYSFNQHYRTKRAFLTSLNKGKDVTFIDAVDTEVVRVINPSTLEEYRKQ